LAGLRDYGEQSTYFAELTMWVDDTAGQVTLQLNPNRCKLRSDSQGSSVHPAHSLDNIWRSSLINTNENAYDIHSPATLFGIPYLDLLCFQNCLKGIVHPKM